VKAIDLSGALRALGVHRVLCLADAGITENTPVISARRVTREKWGAELALPRGVLGKARPARSWNGEAAARPGCQRQKAAPPQEGVDSILSGLAVAGVSASLVPCDFLSCGKKPAPPAYEPAWATAFLAVSAASSAK
jgi:hypothetical protein